MSATTAVLAFFGGLLGYIESAVSGMVSTEESIAMSMGLLDPVVAILVMVAILAAVMVVLRVVVELF